jgi:hypothetical protein
MKKIIFMLFAAAGMLFFSSCEKVVGEGPLVTETRSLNNFKKVSSSISGNVIFQVDPVYKVEVEAQQNILDILETKLIGDELVIRIKDGKRVKSNTGITVTIHAPNCEAVYLSGSGNFLMTGLLNEQNLNLHVSGSGNIDLQNAAVVDKLTATISGSGNIEVRSGAAKNESLRINGSGRIALGDVVADKAITETSGSGEMRVKLLQSLDARISGSGSVFYRGTPAVTTHISGSGRVLPY